MNVIYLEIPFMYIDKADQDFHCIQDKTSITQAIETLLHYPLEYAIFNGGSKSDN